MRCAICNNESLSLNAKYCSKCGNKLLYKNYFCKNCGKKITYKVNFCSECGQKIDFFNNINNDSYIINICTQEENKGETKEQREKIENNNRRDCVNMENNIVKESYLEVLPNQEMMKSTKTEVLPALASDRNLLLPVIIPKKELALVEIKKELNNLKEHKTIIGLLKFTKNVAKILAKLVRFCFIASAGVVGFLGVSALIVMSTAIITKNIVNSYYGSTPQEDTTYSIFRMKE